MSASLRVLILAAGKGTRMKSKKAKVLHKAGGRTLLEHVLRAISSLNAETTVVIGHQADKVRGIAPALAFVEQTEQLGTGHAVLCAKESFRDFSGDILVLPGDAPLVREQTIAEFLDFHRSHGFTASVLTAEVPDPSGYGRIVRRNANEVERIVEHKDATPDVRQIPEINSSMYVFNAAALFNALSQIKNHNAQAEYYLTDVVGILSGQRLPVGAFKAPNFEEILGINTRQELVAIDRLMRRRKCDALMTEGVTIVDPDSTFIDSDVCIGSDSIIYPSVQIYGRSVLAEDVTVHSFARLTDVKIGSRSVVLEGCIVADSTLGEDVSIGPYAHLRLGTQLDDTVKVGNFVEIKKSHLGRGTKSMHLAYVGDATVGKNVNIGAGVITVNYDGTNKHPTHVEDNAFIGSDSQLIAPVRIGHGAFVAAGSTITDDVPADGLAIGRGRQVVKEGRAPHRKGKEKK